MNKGRKFAVILSGVMALLLSLSACTAPNANQDPSPSTSVAPATEQDSSLAPSDRLAETNSQPVASNEPTPVVPRPQPSSPPVSADEVTFITFGPEGCFPGMYEYGDDFTGDPTFREELLPNQSHAQSELEYFYEGCKNLAAALASATAAFPSIAADTELDPLDPIATTEYLYYNPKGGEVQRELLSELWALLESPATQVEVVHVSGRVQMTQGYILEEKLQPNSVVFLMWTQPFFVRDATQLKITHTHPDGTQEVGYFDSDSNYCLTVPVIDEGAE